MFVVVVVVVLVLNLLNGTSTSGLFSATIGYVAPITFNVSCIIMYLNVSDHRVSLSVLSMMLDTAPHRVLRSPSSRIFGIASTE